MPVDLPIYVYVDSATRIRLVQLADEANVPRAKLPALLPLLREDVKARIGESNNSNWVLPFFGTYEKPIRIPKIESGTYIPAEIKAKVEISMNLYFLTEAIQNARIGFGRCCHSHQSPFF